MNYGNNTPAIEPQSAPVLSQASTITAGGSVDSNGLYLVNINNIIIGSLNDLSQATSDLGDAFNSAARAGATALATMRHNGIDEGVTVTTINNFTVGGNEEPRGNPLDIMDLPFKK